MSEYWSCFIRLNNESFFMLIETGISICFQLAAAICLCFFTPHFVFCGHTIVSRWITDVVLSSVHCSKVQPYSVRLIQQKKLVIYRTLDFGRAKRGQRKNVIARRDQPTKCQRQRKWCRGCRSLFITLIFYQAHSKDSESYVRLCSSSWNFTMASHAELSPPSRYPKSNYAHIHTHTLR